MSMNITLASAWESATSWPLRMRFDGRLAAACSAPVLRYARARHRAVSASWNAARLVRPTARFIAAMIDAPLAKLSDA